MGPQDDNQKRRNIILSIQKLGSDLSALNHQKQQLLCELKSIPISERPVIISEEIYSDGRAKLFKELFRGRTDVYAKHWISRKTGKSGYSPVCKNEWVPKICQRLTVRCSECPNREFLPFEYMDPSFLTHCSAVSYNNAPTVFNRRGILFPNVYDS